MDNEWERINEVIEINKEIANELVRSFDSRKVVESIEKFSGGRSTTNYKIKIEGLEQEFVLRIYSKSSNICKKEFEVYKKLGEFIPIPEVYYIDEENNIINKPYAIVQFLDGITLDQQIKDNNEFSTKTAEEIGERLAFIHKTGFNKEGLLDENFNIVEGLPPILSWYDFFINNRAGIRLGSKVKDDLVQCLKANNDLLEEMTSKFVFSHGDFRPSNIMVKDGTLVGILDWEFALSAPAYFDIGQFIRYEEQMIGNSQSSFINAYNKSSGINLTKEWKKIAKLMDLANILSLLDNEEEKPNLFADMVNLTQKTIEILK